MGQRETPRGRWRTDGRATCMCVHVLGVMGGVVEWSGETRERMHDCLLMQED